MEKLLIKGGNILNGEISCSGAKNAALPMIAATILNDEKVIFKNLPYLQDITTMFELLGSMGADISLDESMDFSIASNKLDDLEARYELVKTMRASILVLGPMVAKYGYAKIALPGGCAIGSRPVNFHLDALKELGASISLENGYIEAKAEKLIGTDIVFEGVTVTGTENIMMAACLAEGRTTLKNVAMEPEISDLADLLNKMGAKVHGAGTDVITIDGVDSLYSTTYTIPADRIEAGTYLVAAAITGGKIKINSIQPERLNNVIERLKMSGAIIEVEANSISLDMQKRRPLPVDISTSPFPGFPTDMQAQMMALNTIAEGVSEVTETIFENRFMHVQELIRMGAQIDIRGNTAIIRGKEYLEGASVMATDLRASASLVIASLAARGQTTIERIYHLDRGYEKLEDKLNQLGANIKRIH